ncbi:MAG: hypothetical protein DRR19_05370 [Candidatus Parabeggiatoa sp. nov. 1]|nr:MAG: hypothetical protein DRR19_05370 [Gammaproteobacteria bacterium]HEC86031.1 hypothetical protein [Thioploca sp.]
MKKILDKYWATKNERNNPPWRLHHQSNDSRRHNGLELDTGIRAGHCAFCEKVRGVFGIGQA